MRLGSTHLRISREFKLTPGNGTMFDACVLMEPSINNKPRLKLCQCRKRLNPVCSLTSSRLHISGGDRNIYRLKFIIMQSVCKESSIQKQEYHRHISKYVLFLDRQRSSSHIEMQSAFRTLYQKVIDIALIDFLLIKKLYIG